MEERAMDGDEGTVKTCGCTVNVATGAKTYCGRHQPKVTAKGEATGAVKRALEMLKKGEVSGLEVVLLRGVLEFALEKLDGVEELKKARPKAKDGAQ